ncbi:MAG: TonB-dependent receptor plug domain-containing protein, partial [Pseudomonadota bacterium]
MTGSQRSKDARATLSLSIAVALLAGSLGAHAQIEEVTVTAERREESLRDVSVSVTALNEEALALGGITDVSRLELLVPGLNYSFAGNDAKFNVRGANSSNTFGDNSSIVGAFVDGIYKARASQQTRGFFDVRNVEFLRGPQGTLYGRNTFAGALNVYTNTPDLEGISAGFELSPQRFDRVRSEGYFNAPISDNFGIRIAGYFDKSDGYIENLAGPDVGAQDDKGVRLSALWTPNDRSEFVFRATMIEEDGNEAGLFGYTFLCRNETPEGLTDPFGSVSNCANPVRGSGGLGPASNGPGGDPWRISQDYVRPVDLDDDEFSLIFTYDFDNFSLKSITAYNDYVNDINFDFDFSPTRNSNGGFLEESQGLAQEIQLTSTHDGPLQWTAGLYVSQVEDFASFYIYQATQRNDSVRPTVTLPGIADPFTVLSGTPLVSEATVLGGFFADAAQVDTD